MFFVIRSRRGAGRGELSAVYEPGGKLSAVQKPGGSCQLFSGARGKLLAVLSHTEAASSAGARGKLASVREQVRSFQLFRNQGKLTAVQVPWGSCHLLRIHREAVSCSEAEKSCQQFRGIGS